MAHPEYVGVLVCVLLVVAGRLERMHRRAMYVSAVKMFELPEEEDNEDDDEYAVPCRAVCVSASDGRSARTAIVFRCIRGLDVRPM